MSTFDDGVKPEKQPEPTKQIEAAFETLRDFVKTTKEQKLNKWKDIDGKFNTTRLASDLTAGVVLGTVGGVVSGIVIKKKQIKKGFENLHCTISGQSVADFGDDFKVIMY